MLALAYRFPILLIVLNNYLPLSFNCSYPTPHPPHPLLLFNTNWKSLWFVRRLGVVHEHG